MVEWVSVQRKRMIPGFVVLALVAGLFVSIFMSSNAHGDYYVGCGYGYGVYGSGPGPGRTTFGYGTGYGYGYLNGSATLGFGYGYQVCPVSVTTTSLPGGTVGVAYSQTLQGTGGVTPYTWAVSSGALPNGLTLSSSGTISGTPSVAQTFNFSVTFTDRNGQVSAPQALSIIISPASSGGGGSTGTTTTSTTTSSTTTTVAPSTTTTVAPPPRIWPRLFYVRTLNPAGATSLRIQYRCLPTGKACSASAILWEPVRHHETMMATARITLRSGQQGVATFRYTKAGTASLGGFNHYHKKAVSLVTRVAGGHRTVRVIFVRRWP